MRKDQPGTYTENIEAYEILSLFYRQLLSPRDHFNKQLQLLHTLIERERLNPSARLLDAACGTGDVARGLFEMGFSNIEALDGSQAMVDSARKGNTSIALECTSWTALPDYFSRKGQYDLIFFLGNSLAHLPKDHLPELFPALHNALNNKGILLFDLRPWERNAEGLLREPGRPTNVRRFHGKVAIQNEEYWIDELTSYGSQKQTVSYRLQPLNRQLHTLETAVSYHLFDHEEAKQILSSSGFQPDNVETYKFPDWSYLIVMARK